MFKCNLRKPAAFELTDNKMMATHKFPYSIDCIDTQIPRVICLFSAAHKHQIITRKTETTSCHLTLIAQWLKLDPGGPLSVSFAVVFCPLMFKGITDERNDPPHGYGQQYNEGSTSLHSLVHLISSQSREGQRAGRCFLSRHLFFFCS